MSANNGSIFPDFVKIFKALTQGMHSPKDQEAKEEIQKEMFRTDRTINEMFEEYSHLREQHRTDESDIDLSDAPKELLTPPDDDEEDIIPDSDADLSDIEYSVLPDIYDNTWLGQHGNINHQEKEMSDDELKLIRKLYCIAMQTIASSVSRIDENKWEDDEKMINLANELRYEIKYHKKSYRMDDQEFREQYNLFMKCAKDIDLNNIWSLGYFKSEDKLSKSFYPILKAQFSNEYIIKPNESTKENYIDDYEGKINIQGLYDLVRTETENIKNIITSLQEQITDAVSSMNMDELYETLKHLPEPSEEDKIINTNDIFGYTEKQIRQSITARAASSPAMYYPISNGLLYKMPESFGNAVKSETDRMKQWAWQYMLFYGPKDKFNEDMREVDAAPYMADILPALEPVYKKKYSSFTKRYTSPTRERFFEDQTEHYNQTQGKLNFAKDMMGHDPKTVNDQ